MKRLATIAVIQNGATIGTIQRPVVRGCACFLGKFYEVENGRINVPKLVMLKEKPQRMDRGSMTALLMSMTICGGLPNIKRRDAK